MKIRNEWMTDKDYFAGDYPNNVLLEDAKARFELQKTSLEGKAALVDGVTEQIVVQNHTNPLNQAKYDKKISFDITSSAHTGSILVFDGITWIVTSKMFNKMAYKVGSVLECNNMLKWLDDFGVIQSCPAFIQNKSLYTTGIDTNRFITTPDSKLNGMIPVNSDTINLKRDKRFLLGYGGKLYAYKLTLIDIVTLPGLMLLVMEEDMIKDSDDLQLGVEVVTEEYVSAIPSQTIPSVGWFIRISGVSEVKTNLSQSYSASVYENGVASAEAITWSVSNVDGTDSPYASITSNGTSCTLLAGNYTGKYVTLKAQLVSDATVYAETQIKLVNLF